ncbi:hypothetical protein [Shewanella nanhaiensis]|uniref:RNA helicase n=1 Tax=Shewanella nanhaiensis TaxID=2864872 RepID=A0ABS7E4I7_9GAMM|nr:hypothetical protein [Shewanella nanhaiensis]MBW8184066.1 hypothetical protein [Shewanella nanhaiensis]
MKIKALTALLTSILISNPSVAINFNDIHSCRAHLDFITESNLNPVPSQYSSSDITQIRKSLAEYNQDIMDKYLEPALQEESGGDADKLKLMKDKIVQNHRIIVKNLEARYQDKRIYMELVLAVDNCIKSVRPSDNLNEELNKTVNTMLSLAMKK